MSRRGGYAEAALAGGARQGVPHPAAEFLVSGPFPAFRNQEPRSRETRRALVDKEALEKQRLVERTGGFHKYDFTPSSMLTSMGEGTPGYQPEARRFDTDTAAEERHRRHQRIDRQRQIETAKRATNVAREEERWQQQEASQRAEEERERRLREHSDKAKANRNSMPYDPISLHYHDGKDGDRLKLEEENMRYRAALRAKLLQDHNMSAPYNPVTGETVYTVRVPSQPPGAHRS